ncbi:MAG: hypothetical protein ABSA16_13665 [Thermoguttaceae bacterium]|jgi:hypothetical protein
MNNSAFLFARPSFFEGVGRIFDFAGTLNEYNNSLTPEQADYFAIKSDWRQIGADINQAIQKITGSHGSKETH